jgi:hypothetical protein
VCTHHGDQAVVLGLAGDAVEALVDVLHALVLTVAPSLPICEVFVVRVSAGFVCACVACAVPRNGLKSDESATKSTPDTFAPL